MSNVVLYVGIMIESNRRFFHNYFIYLPSFRTSSPSSGRKQVIIIYKRQDFKKTKLNSTRAAIRAR